MPRTAKTLGERLEEEVRALEADTEGEQDAAKIAAFMDAVDAKVDEKEDSYATAMKVDDIFNDQESLEMRRQLARTQEQLSELTKMVAKMAREGRTLDEIAAEGVEESARRLRQARYERIRRNGGLVTIHIHTHEDMNRNFPVSVGINGNYITIPRGKPVTIPVDYMAVLDDAVVSTWIKEVGRDGNPVMTKYEYLQYPYTILDEHGAAQVQEKLERMGVAA